MGQQPRLKHVVMQHYCDAETSSSFDGVKRLKHISTHFKQLGVLVFVDLVKYKTAFVMYKAYHNELPKRFANHV